MHRGGAQIALSGVRQSGRCEWLPYCAPPPPPSSQGRVCHQNPATRGIGHQAGEGSIRVKETEAQTGPGVAAALDTTSSLLSLLQTTLRSSPSLRLGQAGGVVVAGASAGLGVASLGGGET